MAQVLKEEIRKAIVDAAKDEFLTNGYDDASMRSIALKANITVGNLYRYFKNKEDISLFIIKPTLEKINELFENLTLSQVSCTPRVFNAIPNRLDLIKFVDKLADGLIEINENNKIEFGILFLHSYISKDVTRFLYNLISSIMTQSYILDSLSMEKNILCEAYADAMFKGLQTIFSNDTLDKDVLQNILKTYLRSFVFMLDTDIKKYTE